MDVDPFLDLNGFEKDNVEVELLEDELVVLEVVVLPAVVGKIDLTVTEVPEGMPLTLSRLESSLDSLVTFDVLSFLVGFIIASPSKTFLVMVVCPPSIEGGGACTGTASIESLLLC